MENNKKKITLLVVGILTLLVTVIGATFAYFNMIRENNSSTADISGTTGSFGTVVLETIDKNIFIDLGIDEMSSTNIGKTYYSSNDESIPYNEEITSHDILKTSVVGGDGGLSYTCTYTLNIEGTGYESLNENDAFIVVDGEVIDLTELKNNNPITREIEVMNITNEVGHTLTGYAHINNTESNQNNLRGLDLSLEITASNLKCEYNLDKAYAIYSETDKSLRFYQIAKEPVVGYTYNNLEVTAVYSGFEEDTYEMMLNEDGSVNTVTTPWYEYAEEITSVVVEDEINPISTAYWFYNFQNTTSLDVTNINTSQVTDMTSMFERNGYNVATFNIIGTNNWNTSKVRYMKALFYNAGYNASTWNIGDLSDWDISNVTNMHAMFNSSGYNATNWYVGDLSNWNTECVTSMRNTFAFSGYSATEWGVGNLSDWDTSNVTDMQDLFYQAGYATTTWTVGDLSKWDVSNVTNIIGIFHDSGYNSKSFNVGNLSNWDIAKNESLYGMFWNSGYNATEWYVGDLSNWDTSNVINMRRMFDHAGYNATTWNIGNISDWNTKNVTNMELMFFETGYKASYNLNLSGWDVSNVTVHTNFNYGVTSKVTAPRWVN